MWMIADTGFISAVEYRPRKDRTSQLPDILGPLPKGATRAEKRRHARMIRHGFILARTRVGEDLEQLRPYFPELDIKNDPGADYKFRAVLPRQAYAQFCYDKAMGINYDSHFKEVSRDRSPKDPERYSAMMSCWGALNRMGRPKGYYTTGPGKPVSYGKSTSGGGKGTSGNWSGGHYYGGGASEFGSGASSTQSRQPGSVADRDLDTLFSGPPREHVQALQPIEDKPRAAGAADLDTIQGMVAGLRRQSPESLPVDSKTADTPFFIWNIATELFDGQSASLDQAQVIELLEECLDRAMSNEVAGIEQALAEARDEAADEDEVSVKPAE